MFDNVNCEYLLPGITAGMKLDFQTKSFGDESVGGFMDNYTITKDGQLIFHKTVWELVPDEERPYYGKPEWDKGGLYKMMGSMKSVPQEDEVIEYNGILNIYTISAGKEWIDFNMTFTDGVVSDVERINKEQELK